ncbi:hypothetical protein [Mycoplasmopsis edwardii]|uniref:Uncharacterized protein n=1 Tax=Mycoplasmopsis edwardii TaxID=53558 RepID=A0ACD4PIN8_9BACT|nr:hypothetical protein [Mycoplasmopsis edwardii]WBP83888.1 hypothetical protein Me_995_000514 [Mycoplasmopsis edwardii]
MRQNKNNSRILRRHDVSIKPEEEGLRYKRFMGDKLNMEHVYQPIGGACCGGKCAANKNANLLLAEKNASVKQTAQVEKTVAKETVVVKNNVAQKVESKQVKQEIKAPVYLELKELSNEFWSFFRNLIK